MSYLGIVHDLDEAIYHAHPALSSTKARELLRTPKEYLYNLSHPQPPKTAFDVGTAAHSKVLGVGAGTIVYPDEHLTPSGNVSTKAATVTWAAEQRAAGLVPITPESVEQIDAMAEAILSHSKARLLFEQEGASEVSVFATDTDTGVELRARFDFLPRLDSPNPIAVDLKTTGKKASKEGFERSVKDIGYDVQLGHYLHTLALSERQEVPMVFVVVEKSAPYLVAVHQLDTQWTRMGTQKARIARELLAECTASGEWPGYPEEVNLLSPPTHAVYEHEEKYG